MLHSDQDSRPVSEGSPLHDLAREIEETQRRQSDTLTHIVRRLRALDPGRAAESGAAHGPEPRAGEEPWDAASAEALMQTYEQDAALQGTVAVSPSHQDWLGVRLHDVTQRIKRTLSDLKPGSTAALVEERLDQFQRHIGIALEDVVRRADLDGLRRIEQHVGDIGEELQHLERHVQRIDGVEADLRTVMEQVSDERLARLLDYDSRFAADLEAVATRAAEEIHVRLGQSGDEAAARRHEELRALIEASIQERRQAETEASSLVAGLRGHVSAQADRYDEIKALLEETRQEQRQSEQTALGMLDTLQQALVRLLDRMDVLEEQHRAAPPQPEAPHPAAAFAAAAESAFVPPPVPAEAPHAEAHPGGYAAEPAMVEAPLAEVPAAFVPVGGEELPSEEDAGESTLERLRRDFIADARRAKLKAAANRAEAITEKAEPAWRRGADPAKAAPGESARRAFSAGGGRLFGSSPRLLAGVLALVVAINGGLLLMNRKESTAPPVPEINLPAAAASESGAGDAGEPADGTPDAERRSFLDGNGTDYAGFGAADPRPGLSADHMFTPYGALDDVLNPPPVEAPGDTAAAPLGTTIATPMGSLPDETVADLYTQQVLAGLSGQLGTIAAGKTPDALLPEQKGRIDTSFSAIETAATPDRGTAGGLPPATVGPLSLRLAAANGDASAEFEVGARLAEGKGTAQNFAEAARWYQRSAAKGFAQSQYRLGTLYERGLGVAQDGGRARVWYGRAAEQGNVKAMHNLAVLAAGGENGEADYAAALRWFTEAAEHGLADSQFNLGVLYENGLGVTADRVAAYKWYALAAKSGDADAVGLRDALKAALSKPELGQAERLVAQFKARPPIRLANDALAAGEDWKRRAGGDAKI